MSESSLQRAIQAALTRRGAKCIKLHGSGYMERGTPDLLCVRGGVPYLLEVKLEGGLVTEIQQRRLSEWATAGAVVGVVRSVTEALAVLR